MPDIYYRRNLPHIHPEGYPLFITFRLADSLPMQGLAELKAKREKALKALKTESPIEIHGIEEEYFSHYDEWLDRRATGPRWLENKTIAGMVVEKIHSMDGSQFELIAYCIMPNHVHLLIESLIVSRTHRGQTSKYPVTNALRLLKEAPPAPAI